MSLPGIWIAAPARIIRIEDGKLKNNRSGRSEEYSGKEGPADVSGEE